MISASSDTTLKVWDATSATCLHTVTRHYDYVKALAYSPAKNLLASAGLDKAIHIWDVERLCALATEPASTVTDGAASPRRPDRVMSPMTFANIHSFSTAASPVGSAGSTPRPLTAGG